MQVVVRKTVDPQADKKDGGTADKNVPGKSDTVVASFDAIAPMVYWVTVPQGRIPERASKGGSES